MKKYVFTTVCCLVLSVIFTGKSMATDIIVKLKPKDEVKIENRHFYITKVVDNREDKGKEIGRFTNKKKETVLILENDLEPYFLYYLSVTYPKNQRTSTPVIMIIHSIECERDAKLLSDKANITMDIEFVSEQTNQSLYKYEVRNGIEKLLSDGRTYGKLIEGNLNDCIKQFSESMNK